MKKLLAVMLAVFLLAALAPAAYADDTIYTEGTLYYTVNNESVTIVGCFGKDAEVTVPAMIAGYPVNTIASGAFAENEYVQTLYLPDTISTVEPGAIGDWIYVIYNANTDHPQDTPTDLILGLLEPVPPMDDDVETTVPEVVAQDGTDAQTGSGADDVDETAQGGQQTQTGTQISEQEIDLEEAEETTAEPAPSAPAEEAEANPAPAEEQPDARDEGETAPSPAAEPEQTGPRQTRSGDGFDFGAAAALCAVALLGTGVALAARKKSKTENRD